MVHYNYGMPDRHVHGVVHVTTTIIRTLLNPFAKDAILRHQKNFNKAI